MNLPSVARAMSLPSVAPTPQLTLPWLVRLRWIAVAGQLFTVAAVALVLGVRLPVAAIVGIIAGTATSNLLLWKRLRAPSPPPLKIAGVLLVLDTLALTALLQLSGGPTNPFSTLYLVHVALAVVLLGSRWGWGIVALSAACFGQLFLWHLPLPGLEAAYSPEWAIHLRGTWLAFVVAASVTAHFVGSISAELRRRDEQLAQVHAQIARSEKLASLTTLAAGAAHELGTPLATIAVVSKELERALVRLSAGDALVEDARLIREQVERCRTILLQMSAKAGENAGELPERLDVSVLVSEVRKALTGEQAARLGVAGEDDVASVVAPPQGLVLVLASLVRNAFDAVEANGGTVSLEISREGDWVRLGVHDTGPGMPPEILSRAGEPFFSTKPTGRGMGLGLFLARAFAERLGGRLVLESVAGAGTTAALELPMPLQPAAQAPPAEARTA